MKTEQMLQFLFYEKISKTGKYKILLTETQKDNLDKIKELIKGLY